MKVLALGAVVPLTACSTVPPATTPPSAAPGAGAQCQAAAAQSLRGQKASPESGARALSLTGARTLRWGPPRSAFTMDYRQDRVNVTYDDAMTITEVTCG